jgi:hypothetical protein
VVLPLVRFTCPSKTHDDGSSGSSGSPLPLWRCVRLWGLPASASPLPLTGGWPSPDLNASSETSVGATGPFWVFRPRNGSSSSLEVLRPFGVSGLSESVLCGSTRTPSRFDLSHVLAGLILVRPCGHCFRPLPPLGFPPFRVFSHRLTTTDSSPDVPLLMSVLPLGRDPSSGV